MATEHILLNGTCKWAKVRKPDDKYNNYTIDLYMDKESFSAFELSGLQLTPKEDEDGRFVRFRRPEEKMIKGEVIHYGPPKVVNSDNEVLPDTLIGNGSDVTVRVSVYDSTKGKGHTLEAIRVNELVEFEGGNPHDF